MRYVMYQFEFVFFMKKSSVSKECFFHSKIVIDYFPKCDRKFEPKNYIITVGIEGRF